MLAVRNLDGKPVHLFFSSFTKNIKHNQNKNCLHHTLFLTLLFLLYSWWFIIIRLLTRPVRTAPCMAPYGCTGLFSIWLFITRTVWVMYGSCLFFQLKYCLENLHPYTCTAHFTTRRGCPASKKIIKKCRTCPALSGAFKKNTYLLYI